MNREEKERLERRRRMLARERGEAPLTPPPASKQQPERNARRRSAAHPAPCRPKSKAQLRHRRQRCGPSALFCAAASAAGALPLFWWC